MLVLGGRQATGKRPGRELSTTPHRIGLWGSGGQLTMHHENVSEL